MNYRTQAERDPSTPREEVVELSRFSRAYSITMLVLTIVSLVAAIGAWGATSLDCKSGFGHVAECELVVKRVAFSSHETVKGLGAVEAKRASLGDDGEREYLAIQSTTEPMHWFDTKGHNQEIASDYQRFQKDTSLPPFSRQIERNVIFSAMTLCFTFCFLAVYLLTRKPSRIVVDLESGEVRVAFARFATDGFEGVKVESPDIDSLDQVILLVGDSRHVIGTASTPQATAAATRLDAILRSIWDEKKAQRPAGSEEA